MLSGDIFIKNHYFYKTFNYSTMKKFFIAFALTFVVFFVIFIVFNIVNDYTLKLTGPYKSVVAAMIAGLLTPRIKTINTQSGKKVQVTSFIFKRLNFIY